jgi:dTDP-4-amino-4,6-dideoxygalactose transaminase
MLTLFRHAAGSMTGTEGFPLPDAGATVCRLATGRSALLHLIHRLPSASARTVLIPAYVAEGVIQPFRLAGFEILFYRLQADLKPMVEDVATLLQRVDGSAVVVLIHYFGFSVRTDALSALLMQHDAIVVDDLAHAPLTAGPNGRLLGEGADIALYSLNKFLPVVDGAILLSRRTEIDIAIDESALPELPASAQAAYRAHLEAAAGLAASAPENAQPWLQRVGETYEGYYAVINGDLSPHRQSAESRQMEAAFPYRHLIEQRQANSRILYGELKSPAFALVYPEVPAGVVPFCIPARVPAGRRGEILERLIARGILLSTLQDKWDFIPAGKQGHFALEAAFLYEHVLIPVSEFITAEAMWYMVEQLNLIDLN